MAIVTWSAEGIPKSRLVYFHGLPFICSATDIHLGEGEMSRGDSAISPRVFTYQLGPSVDTILHGVAVQRRIRSAMKLRKVFVLPGSSAFWMSRANAGRMYCSSVDVP